MAPTRDTQRLTEVELELMTVLWKLGKGSVHDVLAGLPEHRKLAYTSVSTVLRILEQKNILQTEKMGRGHQYIPVMSKSEYESYSVHHVLESVFDNAPAALVKRFVESVDLSKKDIEDIQKILNQLGEKQ
jgi:predicted transcriptional regulator